MIASRLKTKLKQFTDKYCDLVWYARQDKTDLKHPGRKNITRIRKQFPRQVAALCGPSSDWHHGFNSGCLATVRLILSLLGTAKEAKQAEKDFPGLDT